MSLNITWYKELSIDKHENYVQTRGGHTSERDKIGKKQWTSDAKNRKKDEIWYY